MKLKFILCSLLLGLTAFAQAKVPEPPVVTYEVTQEVSFLEEAEVIESWEFYEPNAGYVKVHFKEFNIPKGVLVVVRNPENTEKYYYSRTDRGLHTKGHTDDGKNSFYAMSITGDRAVVDLLGWTGNKKSLKNRLVIDKYIAALPDEEVEKIYSEYYSNLMGPESMCGSTVDYRPTACYETSNPIEFERRRPVARINNGTGSRCTAWRVGEGDKMFTNNHCNQTQAHIEAAEVWFNYEWDDCNKTQLSSYVKVPGKDLLATSRDYDFTLFTITDPSLAEPFGWAGLEPVEGAVGERIYIAGHPKALRKHLHIYSDANDSGYCEIDVQSKNGYAIGSDYGYACDSIGGSSGSPVFTAANGRAIALHHFGGCDSNGNGTNGGVKMSKIWPFVSEFFGGIPPNGDQEGPGGINQRPIVDLKAECTFGECSFDASASVDPDGTIVSYEWRFGDGDPVVTTTATTNYTYTTTGVYFVSVTAIDDLNGRGLAGFELPVTLEGETIPPVVKWVYKADNGDYTIDVEDQSFDWDGIITYRMWQFKETYLSADGGWKNIGGDNGPVTYTHTFPIGGQFLVGLTVKDDFGTAKSLWRRLTITGPIMNPKPEACWTAEKKANALVTFTDCSTDDGEIYHYWFQHGDQTFIKQDFLPTEPWDHQYDIPVGECKLFYVINNATDYYGSTGAYGNSRFDVCNNPAPPPPPPEPPKASFTFVVDGNSVAFTDTSTDDNAVVAWDWNFGDGNTSTDQNPTHIYTLPSGTYVANYYVRLTVTDNEGETDYYGTEVSIDLTPPVNIDLTYKIQKAAHGTWWINLFWGGAPGDNVHIYIDGLRITSENDGFYQHIDKRRANGSRVKICAENSTSVCSNTIVLDFKR